MSSKYNLLVSVVLLLSIAGMSSATNIYWDNGGGDGNWNTATNWNPDGVPGTGTTQYARIAMATGPVFTGQTANVYRVYLEGANGTITMNSGTLNTVNHFYAGVILTDTATINMSGGAVNVGTTFYVSRDAGSSATVNLSGGTITCAALTMGSAGGTGGIIDITNTGTLIIDSNNAADVSTYITKGWLRAYGGVGEVMVDVNNINPGKTTVWGAVPTKAGHPSPADDATDVSTWADLSWTGTFEAASHNVYFGTDVNDVNSATDPNVLPGRGNQTALTFDPGELGQSTTYYWRIDEVNGPNTVTGDVWSFKTARTRATPLVNQFCPVHGATGMPIGGIILSWAAGVGAVSHDVYFGTASSGGTSQGNQTDTSFALPTILTPNTTYYWRIDEVTGLGTVTGDVNNFTTGDPVGIYPYLTWRNNPTNSIMVNWWNPAATGDSSVDYGLTDSYGSTANVPALVNYHHVELTSLATGTTYHYRIRSSDGTTGSDNTFTTAPDPNTTSFRFAMYGDPRGTQAEDEPFYTRQGALCDWILAQDFAFALETGDSVWEGASLKAKGKWWPDWFRIEGNLTKSKVVMHTLGNHEVQGGGTYYYWNDFYTAAFPDTNSSIPGNAGRVYSFDYGNVHFVSMGSYQVNVPVLQPAWLIADLTAAKARPNIKWIFVFFHAPMFTNSGHSNRVDCIQYWGPIFDQFGVNAVFQGHNHVYERSYPLITYYNTSNPSSPVWTGKPMPDGEGTVYITNGMGGAEFNNTYTSSLIAAGFGASNLNTTVVVSLTIDGDDRVIVDAIRNDTGVVIDTYDIQPMRLHYDFNKNDIVDVNDLNTLAGSWLNTGIWP